MEKGSGRRKRTSPTTPPTPTSPTTEADEQQQEMEKFYAATAMATNLQVGRLQGRGETRDCGGHGVERFERRTKEEMNKAGEEENGVDLSLSL
ncbi:hypothetical protein OPV22_008361 [Ensete ventricosum]|uniref:Uncharacterized protein n=1 Tax=Ensete ventricosum TaxID=4639 RepID=A0AAV8R852_ENSVE|nr:hypothetical protein OPV22_008361 [Ensete ventricosum]